MRDRNRSCWAPTLLVVLATTTATFAQTVDAKGGPGAATPPDTASLLISGGGNLPAPTPDPAPSPSEQSLNAELLAAPTAEIAPDAGYAPGGWGSVFVDAEYLLLQPRRRALDYVIVSSTNDGIANGPIDTLGLRTSSGIRVGGGYQTPDDNWQLGAYYTYLHSGDSSVATAPVNGALYSTLTHPGFISLVNFASADTNLDYQVLDLEVARRYPMGDTGTIRLIGGARFAWIDQNLTGYYNGISANQAMVNTSETFKGAGLRVGADGQWRVFRGLGVYGRASGSLLSGNFTTSLRETNNAGATVLSNVSEDFNKTVPVAELGLGLSWQRGGFRARIGYEMTNWFGLLDTPDFVHDFSNKIEHRFSDLGLQGMVLQFQWAY